MVHAIADRPTQLGVYASAHQPSSSERFSPPFASTFIPLVPLASHGRRGVFTHTSTPSTNLLCQKHVMVGEKRNVPA